MSLVTIRFYCIDVHWYIRGREDSLSVPRILIIDWIDFRTCETLLDCETTCLSLIDCDGKLSTDTSGIDKPRFGSIGCKKICSMVVSRIDDRWN